MSFNSAFLGGLKYFSYLWRNNFVAKKPNINLYMKKLFLLSLSFVMAFGVAFSQVPVRHEWENPFVNSVGEMPVRAYFVSYDSERSALEKTKTPRHESLDGVWKFNYVKTPDARPVDFYKVGYDVSSWNNIDVPGSWELQGYDAPVYTDTHYPFYAEPPYVPHTYNPVGSYVRTFTVPSAWNDMDVILRFGGVESAYYVWVNGQKVGYSEDSRMTSEFDITSYIKRGEENKIAVEVYRFSDGSYLEGQDYWKYSGIERPVSLIARPKLRVTDFEVKQPLVDNYKNGDFAVKISTNAKDKDAATVEVKLLDGDKAIFSEQQKLTGKTPVLNFAKKIENAKPWTAETPNLYTLVVNMMDKKGNVTESFAHKVGFRTIEITGGQLLVNGVPILIRGVNRQEHNPVKGRTLSVAEMEKDVQMMKQFNINATRCSHYPNYEEWYALCDEYGLYVVDEANLEAHGMDHLLDKTLSNNPDWLQAYNERNRSMIERDKNFTSIIVWSMGNESQYGTHFADIRKKNHERDPSRPTQYEAAWHYDNPETDIIAPMYARNWQLLRYAYNRQEMPMILCEYAHMMGNSGGTLSEYWDLIYKYDNLQGGFIWDWVDQTFDTKDKKGNTIAGYGGDMGYVGIVNDSNFCANGLVAADRSLHPHIFEVKRVYQNVDFKSVPMSYGKINLTNRFDFVDLDSFDFVWNIKADGKIVAEGTFEPKGIPAHTSKVVDLNLPQIDVQPGTEYFLNIKALQREATRALAKGHVVAEEQMQLPMYAEAAVTPNSGNVSVAKNDKGFVVSGDGFSASFDKSNGELSSLVYNGQEMLLQGLRPNFWRPLTDNDVANYTDVRCHTWKTAADDMTVKSFEQVKSDNGTAIIRTVYTLAEQEAEVTVTYTIDAKGAINVAYALDIQNRNVAEIIRVGMRMVLKGEYDNMTWLGRGPHESYADRKKSADVDLYSATVWEQYHPYVRAQETGNKTDVRWSSLQNNAGNGILVVGGDLLNVSAWNFPMDDLKYVPSTIERKHGKSIEKKDMVWFNIDYKQQGLGGDNTWGAPVLTPYQISPVDMSYSFTILPVEQGDDLAAKSKIKLF